MEKHNSQIGKNTLNKKIINILDSEGNKTEENEIVMFQEKIKKMYLDKEKAKNNLKKEINKEQIPQNLKFENTEILGISKTFKNISYENIIKHKDLLGSNSRYIEPLRITKKDKNFQNKDEIKYETKNDIQDKKERNKILLKLLVNKELSRISTISKELRNQSRKQTQKEEKSKKEEKLETKKEDNNNEIIDINNNEKEINIYLNNEVDDIKKESKKEDALKIIELLKIKSNSKKDSNIFQEQINDKNRIINININTNHNIITKNEIINPEPNEKNIISNKNKLIYKGDFLNRFANNKNNNKNFYVKTSDNINDENDINNRYIYKSKNNIYNNNLNEKMRRLKLEKDLAIEINKNELSGEWNKEIKNNQNIKTQEIIFSNDNKNKINYNYMNSFDKNETIQLNDFKNNQNKDNIYSKKNLMTSKNIKYKTNYNFYKNNIPIKENNNQDRIIEKNIYKKNKSILYNKSIPKGNKKKNMLSDNDSLDNKKNKVDIIYYNKKKLSYKNYNHSYDFTKMNKNNLESKIIKLKNNSSFIGKELYYQYNNTKINPINQIYIKKNLINNNVEKKNQNKSVIYINKYISNKNENLNYFYNNSNSNQNEVDLIKTNSKEKKIKYCSNDNTISKNKNFVVLIIEQILVLEDKLKDIIISLSNEKSISNYSLDFWNYFYNSLIFSKFDIIFKGAKDINIIKLSINLILFTIMICYDFSFESNKLINIYLYLSEILELNHKNIILLLDQISNKIILNNRENNWIIRAFNTINNFNLTEENNNNSNNTSNYTEVIFFKIKINISILLKKINYILLTNKTNFNECLLKLFNKIKNESFIYIDDFFKEYLLRENYIECSVTAFTYLKEEQNFEPIPAPYLKINGKKKFTLVLDLDETLINFQINKKNNDEGTLKLRPNLYKFLDSLKNFYEIILFTEASEAYAQLLINAIEENNKYFEYKFYRQHTVIIGNNFIKDLTRLGRPLNSIVIIDNSPQNFKLQKANGIHIKSFFGEEDDEDNTLIDLMTILIRIAKEENDVRKGIIKYHEEIITKITSNIYKHNNIKL